VIEKAGIYATTALSTFIAFIILLIFLDPLVRAIRHFMG
jgi:hypothetical protein